MAHLDGLLGRVGRLAGLDEGERRVRQERGRAEEQARDARRKREALLASLDLPDRDALVAAEAHREAWAALAGRIRLLTARIDELDVGDLAALDLAALAERRAALEAEAAGYEGLVEQVKQTELEIAAASDGTTLEEARAAVVEAEAALVAERDAAFTEHVGLLLADLVEGERAAAHAPPVLRRARGWFARFTRDSFDLELTTDGFAARDTRMGELRALSELSDATRIQLLLAARVAYVEGVEGDGPKLPLFLDEVLSTTDPGRFRPIAETLLELADDGRQIVYVTAQHGEVAAWQAVCAELGRPAPPVFDLGDGALSPPVELPTLTIPVVPSPEGHDARSYARALGVRRPAGFEPVASWHLLYVLQDELVALHRCLVAGIGTIGQWTSLRRRGASLLDEALSSRIDRRIALLTAILDGWRIGRGRLSWEDVARSGIVTPTYEDDLRRLVVEHAEDPRTFLAEVGRLKRFQTKRLEQLEAHLLAEGLLPEEPPRTVDELVSEATVLAAADGEPAGYAGWLVAVVAGFESTTPPEP